MFYIMEVINAIHKPLTDSGGNILQFTDGELAEIERIYLQPDYDNLLKVVEI